MKTIFVSSTFKDFQAERDILSSKVRPMLCMDAGQYGEAVSFCDLRWGIDTSDTTEETATRKILSVCLDQIDRTSPYMVVLLGDRYGFIPGADQIGKALQSRGTALEELEISITHLEIEYGLLTRPENKPHVFVYIRRMQGQMPEDYACESPLHRQKLDALIQRIRSLPGVQLRYYDVRTENGQLQGLEDFARMVRQDLRQDLQAEWEAFKDMPPFEKERLLQLKQIEEKMTRLSLHKALADETTEKLFSGDDRFFALQGNSGCGKSVMFSYICHQLSQQGVFVIPALCQSSPVTGDPSILLDYLLFHMENALKRPHRSISVITGELKEKGIHRQKLEYLEELCASVPESTRIVLALDGLDQLYPGQMSRFNTVLPNAVSAGMRIFVSAVSEFKLPGHYHVVRLKELESDEILHAIHGIQQSYQKTLSPAVCQALCQRPSAGNLLYLSMVILRLCLMNQTDFDIINRRGGGMHRIEERQQEILSELSEDSAALAVSLLKSTAGDDGIRQALSYLAVSRGGLRMTDLQTLVQDDGLTFAPLEMYVYLHLLQEFFMIRQNGCIDFQHKVIRHGLLQELGEDATRIHGRLFTLLEQLPATDPLRGTELVYHAYYGGHSSFIPRHIATLRTYDYFKSAVLLTGKDPDSLGLEDFSVDVDYGFLCQQMAADLHTIIMSENSEKLEELVTMIFSLPPEKPEKNMHPIYWAEFLNKLLPVAFGESDDELRMLYTIFSVLLVYTQSLCKHYTEPSAKRNLALCHRQMAQLASRNTNRDMSDEALEHIRSYVSLLKEDPDRPEEQADSEEKLMILLLQRAHPEDLKEVLSLGEELLKRYNALGKPEVTSRVHLNMGLAFELSSGDGETREKAFQHFMRAVEISSRYAEEKKDSVSITYRILSTLKVGRMCLDVKNHSGALQIFYAAFSYAKAADETFRSNQSRQYVLMAQEGLGMALLGMGGDSRKQGLQLLLSTLYQTEALLKEYADPGLTQMRDRLRVTLSQPPQ